MNAERTRDILKMRLKLADKRLGLLESWYEGVHGEDLQDDDETLAAIENTYGEIQHIKQLLKEWENKNAK